MTYQKILCEKTDRLKFFRFFFKIDGASLIGKKMVKGDEIILSELHDEPSARVVMSTNFVLQIVVDLAHFLMPKIHILPFSF